MMRFLIGLALAVSIPTAAQAQQLFDKIEVGMTKRQIHEAYPTQTKENALHIWQFDMFPDEKVDISLDYPKAGYDVPIERITFGNSTSDHGPAVYARLVEKYGKPDTEDERIQNSRWFGPFRQRVSTWSKDGFIVTYTTDISSQTSNGYNVEIRVGGKAAAF